MLKPELYKKILESNKQRESIALITITDSQTASYVGEKYLLYTDGAIYDENDSSDDFIEQIKNHCLPLLKSKQTATVQVMYKSDVVECYVETFKAPPHLIVAGAGHVSEPVAEIGKMLGFYVTVIDDREEFANRTNFPNVDEVVCSSYIDFFRKVSISSETYILLLTRGHKYDVVSLQELLSREETMDLEERTAYIGMIGSRRRIAGVFEQLKDQFCEHNFSNIYSPVGLDIGAQTPAEIAVSILAEILKIQNGASGNSLKGKIRNYSQLKFRERKNRKVRGG